MIIYRQRAQNTYKTFLSNFEKEVKLNCCDYLFYTQGN